MTRLRVRISRIPGVTPKKVLPRFVVFGAVLGDFEWSEAAEWRDFSTVSGGQRTQPAGGKGQQGRQLRTLSLEVLTQWGSKLPYENPWAPRGVVVRRELQEILRARAPFRMVATMEEAYRSPGAELRMDATLRSLSQVIRHGQPDSRYLSLEIVEYRSAHVDRRKRGRTDRLPTRHKIAKGDTLRKLAKRYYKGKGHFWSAIKRANGGGNGLLKSYGPDEKLDKLLKGKQKTLRIPEPPDPKPLGGAKPGGLLGYEPGGDYLL